MLPGQAPVGANPNWAHTDQNPSRVGYFVTQGLVNLNDNGPEDGGLMVLKGSSKLFETYFDETGRPDVPLTGRVSTSSTD